MKNIQKIQIENKSLIIQNISLYKQNFTDGTTAYKINDDSEYLFLDEIENDILTLNNVLIAIHKINYTKLFIESERYTLDDNFIFLSFGNKTIKWDLQENNINYQPENTQRIINELLNNA